MLSIDNRKLREYPLVSLAYALIVVIMFPKLIANFATSTFGYGGDTYQGMWDLWWVNYAIFHLHTTPYFTNLILYPVGANLVTQTMAPLLGILTYPLQLISLPFAMNTAIIIGIVLSGLFTYILAKYLTGNIPGSFLAGLIFAFSPEHIIQSLGHLQWTNTEFIPLFILFFLLMIKEKKIKYAFYVSISFVFSVFIGDVEQGILLVLLAFFILVYYLLFNKNERKNILSRKFAYHFTLFIIFSFVLGSPGFIPMIQGIMDGVLSYVNTQGSIPYNILYSDTISSFFLPPYTNPIFGSINGYTTFYQNSIVDQYESVAYIGYSILFLVLASIYLAYKKKELAKIGLWLFLAIFFIWLSLGPYIRWSGFPEANSTLLPGLYLLYHHIPLLNVFREPGRFDFATVLVLAILAAFGFKFISEKLSGNRKEILFGIFAIFILIEYWAYFVQQVTPAIIPKAYYYIRQIPGNFSVLILPALPNYTSAAPERYMGVELYYQTAFQKPLVGGYATRMNQTQLSVVEQIPIAVEADYLSNTGRLAFPYPIIENYTQLNLFMLASLNVGFVGIIRQAYNYTDLLQLASYLYNMLGNPVYQSNSTIIFATSNAITNNVGKHIVAYTVGSWFPGYSFCTSVLCNATFARMWWGSNARGIGIYAPANSTNVVMNFTAMYYDGSSNMGIYLNSADNLVKRISLTPYPENYSLSLSLRPGLNILILLTPNATTHSSEFNFGITNITFTSG